MLQKINKYKTLLIKVSHEFERATIRTDKNQDTPAHGTLHHLDEAQRTLAETEEIAHRIDVTLAQDRSRLEHAREQVRCPFSVDELHKFRLFFGGVGPRHSRSHKRSSRSFDQIKMARKAFDLHCLSRNLGPEHRYRVRNQEASCTVEKIWRL